MIHRNSRRARRKSTTALIRLESLEDRVLLAADFQNPINQFDVDASDGAFAVSPVDAIMVINELNDRVVSDPVSGLLPELDPDSVSAFFDVNGDGVVSPVDAISVIEEMNLVRESFSGPAPSLTNPLGFDRVISGTRAALSHGVEHDTLVNSATDRHQSYPDVGANASGDIVVAWQSLKQDGSSWGIFAQRYNSTGAKIGDEFSVNTTTQKSQRDPSVAVGDDGSFMIAWHSVGQDGSSWGVYGQRFDADGVAVGDEFLVNTTTKGAQARPDIAALEGGDFVVTWEGRGVGDRNGIFMRRFSTDTSSDELLVNSATSGDQSRPVITAIPGGEFAIAWQGKGAGDSYGIFMRATTAGELGDQILVNERTSGTQHYPSIDAGPDGQLVVAWKQSDGRGVGVVARQFPSDGTPSSQMIVNQTLKGAQKAPSATYLSDGRFAVSWYGRGAGDNWGTFTRTFNADGTPEADESMVNTTVKSGQTRPSSVAVGAGYVVSWQGRGIGDRSGVFARFYSTEPVGPFNLDPIGNQSADEGGTISFTANVVDLDEVADNVTFSLNADAPVAASIDAATGEFSWVTTEADSGVTNVDVTATEGDFSVTRTVEVTVNEVNAAPVLAAINAATANVDSPLSLVIAEATDEDLPANTLTYTATSVDGSALPAWLSFDADTRTLGGTPAEADVGTVSVEVTVSDGDLTDSETFDIAVVSGPFALSVVTTQTVDEGAELTFTASIIDTDGQADTVTMSATGLPTNATFDADTGVFSWIPGEEDGSTTPTVTITAASTDFTTSSDVTITVNEVNRDPVLDAIVDGAVGVGDAFSVTITATDADLPVDTLTISVDSTSLPAWLSFDAATGILSGTPAEGDVGTTTVTATVDDGNGGTDTETFDVVVSSGPFNLEFAGLQTIDEGSEFNVTVTVVDTDGQTDDVVLAASGLPTDATFNPDTGVLNWTTTEADGPDTYTITISASDATSTAVLLETDLVLTVNEVNQAPVVADIADQDVVVGSALSVGVVAIDPDVPMNAITSFTYTLTQTDGSDLPAWLSFDATSLLLSGTPAAGDAGTINVRVSVEDLGGLIGSEDFAITVSTSVPVLVAVIPDQVTPEDAAFSLDTSPFFNDVDGDALTFTALLADGSALPSWLSIDAATGVLSGTPTGGDVGGQTVQVTASDPSGASVSDDFTLTVGAAVNFAPIAIEQVFRIDPTSASGSSVGTLVATDANGDTLSYAITGGNPLNIFTIDASSGEITIDNAGALQDGTTETLTIEVSDGEATTPVTATITVTSEALAVAYSLRAFDTDGNEITSVTPGQEIEIRLFTQDVRPVGRGVFSAYADLIYQDAFLDISTADDAITFSTTYPASTSPALDTVEDNGIVDELGGLDGISDLGPDALEVVRIKFTVSSVARGTVHLALNTPEELIQHPTIVFGENDHAGLARIDFGSLLLTVDAPSTDGNG